MERHDAGAESDVGGGETAGTAAKPAEGKPATMSEAATTTKAALVTGARLIVRDGQLQSHAFTVFVTEQIEEGMKPVLNYSASHWATERTTLESKDFEAKLVAPRQIRTVTIDDQAVQMEGTLLMFDLHGAVPTAKAAVRILPSIKWTEAASKTTPGSKRIVVAEDEVYLGNLTGAGLWTAGTMIALAVLLAYWAGKKRRSATEPRLSLLPLIMGPDGYLSLWRSQLLIWTFAVGAMVFLFGMMQLHVPNIPDSLVALMGLSLLTGFGAKKGQTEPPVPDAAKEGAAVPVAEPQPPSTPPAVPSFADLISVWNPDRNQVEISLPKAQMVLWTILVVILFCVKSLLGGTLWEVPWAMVALTGFSQAGYVGDKFIKGQS